MSARYWLVKVPISGTAADTANAVFRQFEGVVAGVEVVEITPEHRESNWMERALAARLTNELDATKEKDQ